MTFSLSHIVLLGVAYLLLLFLIAHVVNTRRVPESITNHPMTYVLSMGFSFSALSFYGVVDLAHQFGYGALAYYMGTGAFFLLAPIIQAPLAELCQRFQLRSVADLLTFRYNSQLAGNLATLFILFAVMPLLVLQIQSVADTVVILTEELPSKAASHSEWGRQDTFALFYCLLITCFCMIFGAGYNHYKSLIITMAVESLLKISALMTVGIFSVYVVFGGLGQLDQWLLENQEYLIRLHSPQQNPSSHTLLLVFIATGVLMPHIYHMSHMGQSINQTTRMISWAFPLFLLFMALPVFPILWAGFELKVPLPISYFTLGVPQYANAPFITLIAWVGGLSAASGALVLSVLSLCTMILNQWLLPLLQLQTQKDIYAQLRWLRRGLIAVIVLLGYFIYRWLNHRYSLVDLALIAFIEALQFVPAILAINYWPRANRFGFFAGLIAGTLVWFFGLAVPSVTSWDTVYLPLIDQTVSIGIAAWETVTLLSIGLNITAFMVVSHLTPSSDEERYSADICAENQLSQPFRKILEVSSAKEFKTRLIDSIGSTAAEKEVDQALQFLGLSEEETRPYNLRRLRTRIRTNLSGLLGHSMATDIIDKHFPYRQPSNTDAIDINLMESRLEGMGHKMQGLTADVNQLRLYHLKTLQELPIAICSLGLDDEILLWNKAMETITGINSREVVGSNLTELSDPWGRLIREFANDEQTQINKQSIDHSGNTHWYRLHKTAVQESAAQRMEGQVILITDITDIQLMEQELMHNTRLVSIGRLAAGVAHEIGNPVTGIACLAQNLPYEDRSEERTETAAAILSQTERINSIVKSLVTFAHTGKSQQKNFHAADLHQSVDEAIHLLSLQQDRKSVEYSNQIRTDVLVWGDTQRLIQVFVNLLSNANDASPEYGNITLTDCIKGAFVSVNITDEGSGIAPGLLDQVKDPFFTTKEPGKGTGLGLSVVFNIVEEHNGHMDITSPVAQGRGTRVSLTLPLYYDSFPNKT